MVLTLHIIFALSSLLLTGFAFLRPSRSKLTGSNTLVALTLISGTYLTLRQPSHMAEACSVGLLYLGVMFAGILAVRHKLAQVHGV